MAKALTSKLKKGKKIGVPFIINALGSVFGVLSTVIISRYWGADLLGVSSFATRLLQILLVVSLLGFRMQIIKNVAIWNKGDASIRKEVADLFTTSRKASLIVSFFFTVVFFLGIDIINNLFFQYEGMPHFIRLFIPSLIFLVLTKNNTFIYIGLGKITQSVSYDGFFNTGFLCFLLPLLILIQIEPTVFSLGLAYLLSRLFPFIVSEFRLRGIKQRIGKGVFSSKILYGGKTFFYINAINAIINNFDIIVVAAFLSPKLTAVYAVCSRLAQLTELFSYVFSNMMSSDIAQLNYENSQNVLKNKLFSMVKITIILSLLILIGVLIFGSTVLYFWGDYFSNFDLELNIMIFGAAFSFVFSPFRNVLQLTGKESIDLYCNIVVGAISIFITLILVPYFGLLGAAISFSFKVIVMDLSRWHFSMKSLRKGQ